jgi:hypothetical protein
MEEASATVGYLRKLEEMNDIVVCMTCASSGQRHLFRTFDFGLVEHSEILIPRLNHPAHTLTNDILLQPYSHDEGRGYLCAECYSSILRHQTPQKALCNGYWIGDPPDSLRGLTMAERLSITQRFYGTHRCTLFPRKIITDPETKTQHVDFKVDIRLFNDPRGNGMLVHDLPLRGLVLEKILEIEIQGVWNLPDSFLPPCLQIRRHRVATALHWLIKHNPCYFDVVLNAMFLDVLPDNGVPYHLLPIIQGNRGTYTNYARHRK